MTRQRLTKRQIREDPLVTWAFRTRVWIRDNLRRLLIVAGAAVLVVFVLLAMRNARISANAEAATQLSQAQYNLWGRKPDQAIELADDLISRWPGTSSARMAQLVRGDALLMTGRPKEAEEAYQAFLAGGKTRPVMRLAALRGEAVALEDAGDFREAAARYQQLADKHDRGDLVAVDMVAAGRCLEQAGDVSAAGELYEQVLRRFPDLEDIGLVRLRLHELQDSAGSPG